MKEPPVDLILNSESSFYLDWMGVALAIVLTAAIAWGFWQDWKAGR